jgi:Fic family protein
VPKRLPYTSSKPGRLVPTITLRGRNIGFIPDPLPEVLPLTGSARNLARLARQAAAELHRSVESAPSAQGAVEFLRLREAIRSSVSDRPLAGTISMLSFEGKADDSHREAHAAWKEALLYRSALRAGEGLLHDTTGLPLRELIQHIHYRLFCNQPRKKSFAGRLRRGPIQMGKGDHYVPPPYRHVVPLLHALERQLNRPSQIDPFVLAFMVHYQFESIHPFTDGNGRVGRILLALTLNHWPQQTYPVMYLSAALCNHKDEYTSSMYRVNTHGDWMPWLTFGLNGVIAQARDARLRLAAVGAWKQRCLAGLTGDQRDPVARLLDGLTVQPFVNPQVCASWFGGDAEAASAPLRVLQDAGVLARVNTGGRTPHFVASALVRMLLEPLRPALSPPREPESRPPPSPRRRPGPGVG